QPRLRHRDRLNARTACDRAVRCAPGPIPATAPDGRSRSRARRRSWLQAPRRARARLRAAPAASSAAAVRRAPVRVLPQTAAARSSQCLPGAFAVVDHEDLAVLVVAVLGGDDDS